jgi:hypothetical protein
MQPVTWERRQVRSNQLGRSLELYFETIADAFDLSHVVLADHSGLVQTSHGDPDAGYALAAYAPMLCRAIDPFTRERIHDSLNQYVPAADEERLSLRPFEVLGETLYAIVVGPSGASRDVALTRVMTGARRILSN